MEAFQKRCYKGKRSDGPPARKRQLKMLYRSASKSSADRDTAYKEPKPEFSRHWERGGKPGPY